MFANVRGSPHYKESKVWRWASGSLNQVYIRGSSWCSGTALQINCLFWSLSIFIYFSFISRLYYLLDLATEKGNLFVALSLTLSITNFPICKLGSSYQKLTSELSTPCSAPPNRQSFSPIAPISTIYTFYSLLIHSVRTVALWNVLFYVCTIGVGHKDDSGTCPMGHWDFLLETTNGENSAY